MRLVTSRDLRRNLRVSVAASAAPYGYTLTVFSTGSVAAYEIDKPHVFELLLFVAGAVLGFLAVEVAAYEGLRVHPGQNAPGPVEAWGHAHLISTGLAIGASWAVLQAVDSTVGWLVVGFVSTAVYLVVFAVQRTLAARAAR
jgi:hypothetical protein